MKAATENNDKTKMSLIRSLYTWKALSIMSLISGAALFLFLSPLSPLYLERGVMGPLIQSLNHALFPSLSPENLNGIITGIIEPKWYYYGNYCFYILSFYRSDGFKNRIPT